LKSAILRYMGQNKITDLASAFVPPDLAAHTHRPEDFIRAKSPLEAAAEANHASEFHERLTRWIHQFNAGLDEDHEVGVRLVNFGQSVVFHLQRINYWNPSLISFSGTTEDGNPVELIQHVSQISILLLKLPRNDVSKPKIGFSVENTAE
jgi:hypothetical protein